jgi:ribosome-associated protein
LSLSEESAALRGQLRHSWSEEQPASEAASGVVREEPSLTIAIDVEGAAFSAPPETVGAVRSTDTPLQAVLASLSDSKAEDVTAIDITGKTTLGDHMVVASGRSHRHVGAIAEHLLHDLKEGGFGNARVEGLPQCDWVLIDAGDVIVHVFRPEVRSFYNLEKMWAAEPAAKVRLTG